jgi:hypothetical protein
VGAFTGKKIALRVRRVRHALPAVAPLLIMR